MNGTLDVSFDLSKTRRRGGDSESVGESKGFGQMRLSWDELRLSNNTSAGLRVVRDGYNMRDSRRIAWGPGVQTRRDVIWAYSGFGKRQSTKYGLFRFVCLGLYVSN